MAKIPSQKALEERNLRMAPDAQSVLEAILCDAHGEMDCGSCGERVRPLCPDCEAPLLMKSFSQVHRQTAVDVLKMAGVGPIERRKSEKEPPSDPLLLIKELRGIIAALPRAEQLALARETFGDSMFLPTVVESEILDVEPLDDARQS